MGDLLFIALSLAFFAIAALALLAMRKL